MHQNPITNLQRSQKIFSLFSWNKLKDEFLLAQNTDKAYLYFKKYRLNLVNNKIEKKSIHTFLQTIADIKLNNEFKNPIVIHLYYELGFYYQELEYLLQNDQALALEIHYKDYSFHKGSDLFSTCNLPKIKLESYPSKMEYYKKFQKCLHELKMGNAYQINLTFPFHLSFSNKYCSELSSWMTSLWRDPSKRGVYAHSTYIPSIKKFIISNSPECLFEIKEKKSGQNILQTRPIKGTRKIQNKKWLKEWRKLISSKKEQAELFMISDLLRNDLNKIEQPLAKVVTNKIPLLVPGILHQYSLIEVDLSSRVSLGNIVKSLFPGGSITGAPKKKVMQLINLIEKDKRGLYTGSTLFLFKKIKKASINIRTFDVDLNQLTASYGAGGGITLLAKKESEFNEMMLKVKSSLDFFDSIERFHPNKLN